MKLARHPTEMMRQPGAPALPGYLRHKPMSPACAHPGKLLRIRTRACFGAQRRPQRPKSCIKLARHPTGTMRQPGAPGRAECRRHMSISLAFHRALLSWASSAACCGAPSYSGAGLPSEIQLRGRACRSGFCFNGPLVICTRIPYFGRASSVYSNSG